MLNKFKLILALFVLCFPIKNFSQVQGKVMLSKYLVNPEEFYANSSLTLNTTVWYKNKQSIQEIHQIRSVTDSTGTRSNIELKYYLFIDPDLQEYFYYGSFSDTSRILMHYKGGNPFEKHGGWNLYSNTKFSYDDSLRLCDTIINEKNYKRFGYGRKNNGKKNLFVLYSSDENKDVPIKYLKPFSEEIGSPVVRMDTFYDDRLVVIDQFNYVSDTLTSHEKKVFQAWQNNLEKKYLNKH